jgi:hypothetical protein
MISLIFIDQQTCHELIKLGFKSQFLGIHDIQKNDEQFMNLKKRKKYIHYECSLCIMDNARCPNKKELEKYNVMAILNGTHGFKNQHDNTPLCFSTK